MVKYQDLIRFIQLKLPNSKIHFKFQGKSSISKEIDRVIIKTDINGEEIQFNLGENLVFILEGVPRAILKNQVLLKSNEVQKFVENCINNVEIYLQSTNIPNIQNHVRRYFGNELEIKKLKKAIYIYYDLFYFIVTPEIIILCLKSNNRTVTVIQIKDKINLDNIFNKLKYFVNDIRDGRIF